MMPSIDIPPTRLIGKRFKIRKLQYNTYELDHTGVKGQLRVISIPVNIFEVPRDLLPKDANVEFPFYMIGFQSIVAVTNAGEKREPTPMPPSTDPKTVKKMDITSFIIDQQSYEPWNEFILQGNPPIMIKTRTILTKLEWLQDYTDPFGDPSLWASHNTTHSVSYAPVGEGGMP